MLLQLIVKNFAIIDNLTIDFKDNLTIVTGESGAGKSIIIRALKLICGARFDKSSIIDGKTTQIIAEFKVSENNTIAFLRNLGFTDSNNCIVRRTISANGKSKIFINDIPSTLATLQILSAQLIDIHGQNQHQLLLQNSEQLKILDNYTNANKLLSEIKVAAKQLNLLIKRINGIEEKSQQNLQKIDFLSYQMQELTASNLNIEELQSIENAHKISNNSKQLLEDISEINSNLSSENINNIMADSIANLTKNCYIDNSLKSALLCLQSAEINLQECNFELDKYLNSLDIDDENIAYLHNRLELLYNLSRKHNCQIIDLLDIKEQIYSQIADIQNSNGILDALKDKKQLLINEYLKLSNNLSNNRKKSAISLGKNVSSLMNDMGINGAKFIVDITPKEGFYTNGNDAVEFLVATNNGNFAKPLKKIASGGELSRISLAIAVTTTNSYAPSLIFDEVDVGISGETALVVGAKLQQLAQKHQTICITHLPQVASMGKQHLLISKNIHKNSTKAAANYLNFSARQQEIAKILGGNNNSQTTMDLAKEMLGNAVC